jgi:APA family basic amino acid/polyamine antiporter
VISFLLAGITYVFSPLSYAELASAIPVSGSAYVVTATGTHGCAATPRGLMWVRCS